MARKLTKQVLDRLKPPAKGSKITWDAEIPGFGVRVTESGAVAFILNYRIFGRQRRYTIGPYPELPATAARERAIELRAEIRAGNDPLKERDDMRREPLMDDLIDSYLKSDETKKKRPNTLRDYKRMAEKIIRPKLGKYQLRAINHHDIASLHGSLKDHPYQANRVLALLSSMMSYAMSKKWVDENPCRQVERYGEEKRERYLSADELARFREALDAYHDQNAANALRLLLLTGARAGEVLKATWEQFDLERGVWTKPSAHTKQKRTEHIPLSAPALELLASMKPAKARGPLFAGAEPKRSRVTLRRPWVQACKAAGLVEVEVVKGKRRHEVKKYRPTVRIHDLRHSFASYLASNGVSLQIIGKLLGHTQAATTMRYAHLQDESLRAATNQAAKVISIQTRRRGA